MTSFQTKTQIGLGSPPTAGKWEHLSAFFIFLCYNITKDKFMTDKEKKEKILKAITDYEKAVDKLRQEYHRKIEKILSEIDKIKLQQIKKKLGL